MRSLSDYWRCDKTDDRVLELASILAGANTAVGLVGANCRAVWSGQSYQEPRTKTVYLDAAPLQGLDAPIDGRAVDVVIGLALHEAGHSVWSIQRDPWWEAKGQGYLSRGDYTPEKEKLFGKVYNLLEDNFIDQQLSKKSVARAEYIRLAREYFKHPKAQEGVDRLSKLDNPCFDDIYGIISAITLYDCTKPKECNTATGEAIDFLLEKTIDYIQQRDKKKRLKIACEVFIYMSRFPFVRIETIPLPPPVTSAPADDTESQGELVTKPDTGEEEGEEPLRLDRPVPTEEEVEESEETEESTTTGPGGLADESGLDEEKDKEIDQVIAQSLTGGLEPGHLADMDEMWEKARENKTSLDKETVEDLDEAILSQRQDLTGKLREQNLHNSWRGKVRLQNAVFDLNAYIKAKQRVADEITKTAQAFRLKERIESSYLTGRYSGKLDTRRLTRVGCGKYNVFKQRLRKEEPSLAVIFLMDCSGSMSGYMDIVADSAVVFAEAMARKKNTYYEVVTYTGGFDVSQYRVASSAMRKICLKSISASGGTPSGSAIGSMGLLLKDRPEREKLIVHFTDGAPDSSYSVAQAVKWCRGYNIKVRTIGAGRYMPASLKDQYGEENYETIESVRDLPRAIGELTRKL